MKGVVAHGTPILLIGSCFTDNIGGLMATRGFEVTVNPFGPLYNPLSLLRAVERLAEGSHITETDIFSHGGLNHSFDFHSRYSRRSAGETLQAMNESISHASEALHDASVVIVTLGTTRVFRLADSPERVVANCHKLPAATFVEERLSLADTRQALHSLAATIRRVNPAAHIIFTISPLRYLGGGAHDNLIIKSTLALALEEVMAAWDHTSYFPAYEIMMDDLRDYRFYAEDMRHPSAVAVDYIFDLFLRSMCTDSTIALADEAHRLTRRLAHRDMGGNPASTAPGHQALIEQFINLHHCTRTALSRLL